VIADRSLYAICRAWQLQAEPGIFIAGIQREEIPVRNKLLIVHGYSDGSESFVGLQSFLKVRAGYGDDEIFFVDYTSMDDETTYHDIAAKLDRDCRKRFKGERIDVVCHSTGALVVRGWLALHNERARLRTPDGEKLPPCPVERLICFAPANFGSDLAVLGQSFLSKFRTTLFNNNSQSEDAFETGKVLLQGLEPASPFQWMLSMLDLHSEHTTYFSPDQPEERRCYPFVIAAGNSYTGLQAQLIKQRAMPGTDGTVRIPGTSLNTRKCTLDFREDASPDLYWHPEKKFAKIPFAVCMGFNHGSIIDPDTDGFSFDDGPGALALRALGVDSNEKYAQVAGEFDKAMASNYKRAEGVAQRCYQQFFFKVRDDVDSPVSDYYIDFFVMGEDGKPIADLTASFDEYIQAAFSRHSVDSSHRCLLLDCTQLEQLDKELTERKAKLMMQVNGISHSPDVKYYPQTFMVYDPEEDVEIYFLCPNTTTLVDIVLNRRQVDRMVVLKDSALRPLTFASRVPTVAEALGGRADLLPRAGDGN
jgi:pimeloyl-ACP methyl ester carboxylesterase